MGFKIDRCPLALSGQIDKIYIQAFADYQKSILPNPGGWLDQPMKFRSIMNVIEETVARLQEEKQNA